jgi:hypothetical protein
MAASLIQPASSNNFSPGSSFSSAGAYASNVSSGGSTLICAMASGSANAIQAVRDALNGGWQLAAQATNANDTIGIFYMQNANPGATTVTCSWQGSAGALRFGLQEWGGLTLVPLDRNGVVVANSIGSTSSPSTGLSTYPTQYPNSVVISAISGASGTPTITAAGGATLDYGTVGRFGIEYQTLNAQAQVSGAFGYASPDFGCIAVATFIVSPANITMPYLS